MFDHNNQYINDPFDSLEDPYSRCRSIVTTDYGPFPFTIDLSKAAMNNNDFLTALWTGVHLQLTLMSIQVGDDIGLEVHPDDDQFLFIESGNGVIQMGNEKDCLYFQQPVFNNSAIFIPAGVWHNLINTGE